MEPVLNIKVGQSVTYAPTIYPSNTTYKTDIQWGYKTAQVRAKEAWIQYYVNGRKTHDRLNGQDCFTACPANLMFMAENLAWGQTSAREVILDPSFGWAETNLGYAGQGHRRNMLDSHATRIGIACYEQDGKTCWAMCLG